MSHLSLGFLNQLNRRIGFRFNCSSLFKYPNARTYPQAIVSITRILQLAPFDCTTVQVYEVNLLRFLCPLP